MLDAGSPRPPGPPGPPVVPSGDNSKAVRKGPRLGHKKSRYGCQKCKLRRVKCDEAKPACKECRKHDVPCIYQHLQLGGPTSSSSPGSWPRPHSKPPLDAPLSAGPAPNPGTNSPGPGPGPSGNRPTSVSGPDPVVYGPASHPPLPPTTTYPTYPPMAIQALNNPFTEASGPSPITSTSYPPISASVNHFRLSAAPGPKYDPPTPPLSAEPSSYRSHTTDDPFGYITVSSVKDHETFKSDPLHDHTQGFISSDFDLYNYYIGRTASTLSRGLHDRIWAIELPRLAITSKFLTHNMLSTSAFHLAYTTAEGGSVADSVADSASVSDSDSYGEKRKKYAAAGRRHFNLAVTGIRQVLLQDSVTPSNCHALFCSSSLLFIGALADRGPVLATLATPGPGKGASSFIHELVSVFRMVKGIGGVVNAQEAILREGPVGALFSSTPSPEEEHPMLRGLMRRGRVVKEMGMDTQTVIKEINLMIDSIQFALRTSVTPEGDFIAVWPISMSEEFLGMLVRPERPPQQHGQKQQEQYRNPVALALVGYYCCVMKETERQCWFTKGWAEAVVKEVVADLEEMAGVSTSASGSGGGGYDVYRQPQTVVHQQTEKQSECSSSSSSSPWVTYWLREAKWAEAWVLGRGTCNNGSSSTSSSPVPTTTTTTTTTAAAAFSNAPPTVVTRGPDVGIRGHQPGVLPTPVTTTTMPPDVVPVPVTGTTQGTSTSSWLPLPPSVDVPATSTTQGQQPATPAVFSNSPIMGTTGQRHELGVSRPALTTCRTPREDAAVTGGRG
ncbi:hypothetical protein B0T20DRAFT_491757 [Sordaria brevicollis]|uniref:Zn(2)-C6 fungal-type domain-containing protein n=1 Tax=Sordaria brevicollis TaxID=83679 RepID=A0AAE0PJQ9_SORBR|nr:hypothetical protein B0T20DRAFT_491757 [Sordaria brevicollis]